MSFAAVCLMVLVAVLMLSCLSSLNVGLGAFAAAWILGAYVAPWFGVDMTAKTVVAGFPVDLFLNLAGTTLLFSAAQSNGTLGLVVDRAVALVGARNWSALPIFFLLSAALAAAGPGNVASTALLAPSAMAVAARLRIHPAAMIVAVGHGSIAGGMSSITPIGLTILSSFEKLGLSDSFAKIFALNFAANVAAALAGWLIFHHRSAEKSQGEPTVDRPHANSNEPAAHLGSGERPASTVYTSRHGLTLAVIGLLIGAAVVVPNLHVGLAAILGAVVLFLSRKAEEAVAVKSMPWNVILMVSGMATLVALCEKAGAVGLLSAAMGRVADEGTAAPAAAFVTGVISIFSSTSGVVLPTFLPATGGFATETGGALVDVATGIVVGSNLVDVSPLSTIGALCISAAVVSRTDAKRLFNQTLIWGFAMAPIAALFVFAVTR
jgi:Na+/H+ antiporter NhaD/arsenite permease-like protein